MRTILLSGRIVNDAEKRITQNGKEYIQFRFVNDEMSDRDMNGNPKSYWFGVTSFNVRHINAMKWLTKGKPINLIGTYKDRIYQNRTSGQFEIGRDIEMVDFSFMPFSDNNGQPQQGASHGQPLTPQPGPAAPVPPTAAVPNPAAATTTTAQQPIPQVTSAPNTGYVPNTPPPSVAMDNDDLPF